MKQAIRLSITGKRAQASSGQIHQGIHLLKRCMGSFLLLLLVALTASSLRAQTTWTYSSGNNNIDWEDTTRWTPASVPDEVGGIVVLYLNSTGTRNVKINSPHTIASLSAGKGGANSSRMWVFSIPGTLTLDNTGFSGKPYVGEPSNYGYQEYPIVFAGTQGVRFGGGGTMKINGNNTFTGDVEFNRSTTIIGHVNALPHGARTGNVTFVNSGSGYGTMDLAGLSITINGLSSPAVGAGTITSSTVGSCTLTVGDNDQGGDFGGIIQDGSSTMAVTKIGTGTLIFRGANSYTGATTVNGGTLQVIDGGTIFSSTAINVGAGATLDISGVTNTPINFSQTFNGTGGTGTLMGDLSLFGNINLTFASGTPTLDVASGTLTLFGNPLTVIVSGSPLGSGSYKLISKSGTGTVAGSVGGVTIAGAGIVGGGTPALSIVGGELFLDITGGVPVLEWGSGDGTWAVGTSGWNSGGAANWVDGDAAVLGDTYSSGNPTLTLNTEVLPQVVYASSTKHYTISGTGDIGGGTEVRVLGPGIVSLAVSNTYTGGTVLSGGTLDIKNASALGSTAGALTITGGALDNSTGGALTTGDYPQSWNGDFSFTGTSDLNLGVGAVTLSASRTITANANALTIGGDISGFGLNLTKAGAGTLALNGTVGTDTGSITVNAGTLRLGGNNTFTGGVTINDGELVVDNDGALNSSAPNAVTFQADADTKALSLNGHSITVANLAMGIAGGGTATVVRNNHATTPVTLTIDVSASTTYAGSIADGGAAPLALTKLGSGNWTFGGGGIGSGTYSGDTIISGGTITAGANNILPFGPGKGNLIVGGVFDIFDRSSMSINGLIGTGLVNRSNPGGSPVCTLTIGNGDASGSFSGQIRNTGSGATLNVVKTGSGTQVLSGTNTYSGTTVVNGGTLLVNSPGTLHTSSAVTVNTGATVGGSGTIGGPVTVNPGGTISAGDSPGILTLGGGLDLSPGGTNVWELNSYTDDSDGTPGTDFDQIFVEDGIPTLGGSSVLSLRFTGTASAPNGSDAFWQTSHNWTIISATGAASNFATIEDAVYGVGYFTTSVQAGGIVLTYTPGTPVFPVTSFSIATGPGSDMTLSYSGGAGSQFVLVQTNDVAAPLNTWTRVQTNNATPGSFTVTPGSDPMQFYRILSE